MRSAGLIIAIAVAIGSQAQPVLMKFQQSKRPTRNPDDRSGLTAHVRAAIPGMLYRDMMTTVLSLPNYRTRTSWRT
jgi:hypothetical protein